MSTVPNMPDFAGVLAATKALGDPTRLRILAVLSGHELTVTELCAVLDQSQPRVSRHLKLLVDAGLLDRHAQGAQAFYRVGSRLLATELLSALGLLIDRRDPVIARDEHRLGVVRLAREMEANEYFERIAGQWDEMRSRHVDDESVEQAVLAAIPDDEALRVLDLGTGTGRMLEVVADRVVSGLGIDLSREMLHLARTRLEHNGHRHLRVRHGSINDLDVPAGSYDLTVLHHVLHFLDEPALAIEQAARATVDGGTLLVVDFAPHGLEELRDRHAHRRLGISDQEMAQWCDSAGFEIDLVQHLCVPKPLADESLTVSLWRARRRTRLRTDQVLEAAS